MRDRSVSPRKRSESFPRASARGKASKRFDKCPASRPRAISAPRCAQRMSLPANAKRKMQVNYTRRVKGEGRMKGARRCLMRDGSAQREATSCRRNNANVIASSPRQVPGSLAGACSYVDEMEDDVHEAEVKILRLTLRARSNRPMNNQAGTPRRSRSRDFRALLEGIDATRN